MQLNHSRLRYYIMGHNSFKSLWNIHARKHMTNLKIIFALSIIQARSLIHKHKSGTCTNRLCVWVWVNVYCCIFRCSTGTKHTHPHLCCIPAADCVGENEHMHCYHDKKLCHIRLLLPCHEYMKNTQPQIPGQREQNQPRFGAEQCMYGTKTLFPLWYLYSGNII